MKVNIARVIEELHLVPVEQFIRDATDGPFPQPGTHPLAEHIARCIEEAGGPLLDDAGLDNLADDLSTTISLLGDVVNTIEKQLAANMRKKVLSEVAQWLDTDTIAQMLVEHLEAVGKPATVGNCQELWLDAIECMASNIGNSHGLV
jgi:hypothetical protein